MQAIALIAACLAFSCQARRVQTATAQEMEVNDDAVRKLATVLLAFSSQPLGAVKGTTQQIGSRVASRAQMTEDPKFDTAELRTSIENLYKKMTELCRDDESSGCDIDMIETLKSFPNLAALRKFIFSAEIRELCRDDESSGCDLDMIEALRDTFNKNIPELCRDDESTGCDLEMIEALKATMIEKAGEQLKVMVPDATVEKVDDYGLPA
mmetsp:Transcript_69503/g.132620  ORF Transcript_69503/g.132620 Transcript_69503/m.132620 type:complete len:210 (+) Transcript_69503:81-710(+)